MDERFSSLQKRILLTCVLVGYVVGPQFVSDEVTKAGHAFNREKLYVVMVKYVTPVLLALLLLQALGIVTF